MSNHLTIDARLAHASGIGTYIRSVVPRVIALMHEARFTLLGDPSLLTGLVPDTPRVQVRACDAPVYGVREQLTVPRLVPRDTTLFWAPHYNIPLLYFGALAVTVHDVNHLALPQCSRVRDWYAQLMFRVVCRRAGVVFCDSRFTEEELTRRASVPRRAMVVHLGVDRSWFQLPDSPSPLADPYFLFVGNVKPHKNLGRLLEAFAAARIGRHRLVIAGRREGFLTADDSVAASAAALGDRVLFTGQLSQSVLEQYIAACDALVLPSLYEGFGLPPLEAMAGGRAVAVSRAGSLPEVCGPEAIYFDPLEVGSITATLEALADRPIDSADVRARRRAWAARYDWDRCAAETVAGLRECAEERSS